MDSIIDSLKEAIIELIKEIFCDLIQSSLGKAAETLNDLLSLGIDSLTQTPAEWASSIGGGGSPVFNTIQSISEMAIQPVALGIMSIIICYDLITTCIDRNNMKDFDTSIFFRFALKSAIAIYLVDHTFEISMAIFDIGKFISQKAFGTLINTSALNYEVILSDEFKTELMQANIGDLIIGTMLASLVYLMMIIMTIIVMVVLAGRMIEIFMYCSAAPIPFATLTNKEWSNIGTTYIKNLLALALQAFFIIIAIALFVTLFMNNVNSFSDYGGLTSAMLKWLGYSAVLCFTLLKTGSISKAIVNGH